MSELTPIESAHHVDSETAHHVLLLTSTNTFVMNFTGSFLGSSFNGIPQADEPVPITLSIPDIHGDGSGTTPFTREYRADATLTLTVPQQIAFADQPVPPDFYDDGGYPFKQWHFNTGPFSFYRYENPLTLSSGGLPVYNATIIRAEYTRWMLKPDPASAAVGVPIFIGPNPVGGGYNDTLFHSLFPPDPDLIPPNVWILRIGSINNPKSDAINSPIGTYDTTAMVGSGYPSTVTLSRGDLE